MRKKGRARFDIHTAMTMKIVFWDAMPFSRTEIYRRSAGTCCCFCPDDGGIYGDIPHFGQVVLIRPHNCTVRDLPWYADVKNKSSGYSNHLVSMAAESKNVETSLQFGRKTR
jgi:hypothetical protein